MERAVTARSRTGQVLAAPEIGDGFGGAGGAAALRAPRREESLLSSKLGIPGTLAGHAA